MTSRDREQSQGQEQGEGVCPDAAGHPGHPPTHLAPGTRDDRPGPWLQELVRVSLQLHACVSSLPGVGQKTLREVPGAGYLHFFCRMLCLALMNARMSESVWLSPVSGMDDVGLSEIEGKRASQCYKSLHLGIPLY